MLNFCETYLIHVFPKTSIEILFVEYLDV